MTDHRVSISRVLKTDPLIQNPVYGDEQIFSNLMHKFIPISQPQDVSEQSPSFQSKEVSLLQYPQTNRQHNLSCNDLEDAIIQENKQSQQESMDQQELTQKLSHFFEEFSSQASIEKQSVLAPLQICTLIWNLILLSNNISLIIIIPLFQSKYLLIFIALKLIDVVIVIISPFYQDGKLIQKFDQILNNYLAKLFQRDFVHIFALLIIMIFQFDSIYIKQIFTIIIIVSNWKRTLQILTQLQIYIFYLLKRKLIVPQDIIKILNTLAKLIIVIHVLTCIWVEVESDEHINIYSQALFHVVSFLSMNSTYIPQNEDQIILCIIMGIISVIFQAFVYCSMKELDIFKNNNETVSLTQFDDLSAELFLKVTSFKQQQINQKNRNNSNFIQQLPDQLKREITLSSSYKYISNYFKNYEEKSIKSIALLCETITILPYSPIIQFQQSDDCSLYFIIKGKVNAFSNHNVLLGSFHEGETFGELSFIAQLPRSANIVSSSQCQLLKLSRSNFLNCLTSTDQQLFCKTKDDLLFNLIYPSTCFCCGLNNHVIINCPQLTYRPKKIDIIKNSLKMQNQERNKYLRLNCNRRMHSKKLIKQFQLDRSEFIDLYCENTAQIPEITLSSNLPYENTYSQQAIPQRQPIEEEYSSDFNDGYTSNSNEDPEFRRLPDPYSSSDIDPFIRKDANKNTINTAGFGKKYVDSQIQENVESCSILDCFKKSELDRKTTDQRKLNPPTAFPSNQYISELIMKQINSAQNINSQDSLKLSSKGTFLQNRTQSQREKSTNLQQFQSQSNSKSKTSSCFVPFSGYDNVDRYSVYFTDFERMCVYDKFYPQYNYKQVIDEINKQKNNKQ